MGGGEKERCSIKEKGKGESLEETQRRKTTETETT